MEVALEASKNIFRIEIRKILDLRDLGAIGAHFGLQNIDSREVAGKIFQNKELAARFRDFVSWNPTLSQKTRQGWGNRLQMRGNRGEMDAPISPISPACDRRKLGFCTRCKFGLFMRDE